MQKLAVLQYIIPCIWSLYTLRGKCYNDVDPLHTVTFRNFLDRLEVESYPEIQCGWSTGQFDLYDSQVISMWKVNYMTVDFIE